MALGMNQALATVERGQSIFIKSKWRRRIPQQTMGHPKTKGCRLPVSIEQPTINAIILKKHIINHIYVRQWLRL
jgi:hypothetical protein